MRQLAIAMNLLIVLCLLATCGANQREQTIKATLVTVNQLRDGFVIVDGEIQQAIIAACNPPACFKDEAMRQVNAYRAAREDVVQAFETAYRAIATVAITSAELTTMIEAADRIKALITTLKEKHSP